MKMPMLLLSAVFAASVVHAEANYGPADAEVLSVLAAINQNEIEAADVAVAKSVSPQVLNYAKMMEEHHKANLADTEKLLKKTGPAPVDQAQSAVLRVKGKEELSSIDSLEGARFNAAYIDLMVKGHTEALNTLDKDLLKKARSQDVKTHLTETRNRVAAHLAEARRIQAGLPH